MRQRRTRVSESRVASGSPVDPIASYYCSTHPSALNHSTSSGLRVSAGFGLDGTCFQSIANRVRPVQTILACDAAAWGSVTQGILNRLHRPIGGIPGTIAVLETQPQRAAATKTSANRIRAIVFIKQSANGYNTTAFSRMRRQTITNARTLHRLHLADSRGDVVF